MLERIHTAYAPAIQRCYESYLKKDPTAQGKITLMFTVGKTGRTVAADAHGVADEVDHCVTAQMSSWQFPIPKDSHGNATIADFRVALVLISH